MADKTITGIVTWLKGWFYDKDEITTKENALQTQINNKASQSDLNTLSSTVSGKADSVHTHSSTDVVESSALSNIGTSANASQSVVNRAVDSMVGSLSTSITNLVQVQYVSLNFGSINSGANSTKTATVTACPSGYTSMIVPKTTSWCIVYSSSVSGTTLSVSVSNSSSISHTCSCGVYVIYYPSTWNI